MRRSSPETIVLIQRLFKPLILREKITGSRNYAALLSKIAEANDPTCIEYIVPFLLSSNRNVARTAAKAVHKVLLATPLTDLPWLDDNLRLHFFVKDTPRSTYSFIKDATGQPFLVVNQDGREVWRGKKVK
jgi:hypothetical protein